jgi:hypothetical protein
MPSTTASTDPIFIVLAGDERQGIKIARDLAHHGFKAEYIRDGLILHGIDSRRTIFVLTEDYENHPGWPYLQSQVNVLISLGALTISAPGHEPLPAKREIPDASKYAEVFIGGPLNGQRRQGWEIQLDHETLQFRAPADAPVIAARDIREMRAETQFAYTTHTYYRATAAVFGELITVWLHETRGGTRAAHRLISNYLLRDMEA